ncbi:AMP-binding protein [Demetria terragena]|uniref:AMP-binding protein n=1 Tax=Demetria terragena TaxID=63959 RepID=UPI00058CD036|nr:AMP-binding protein [Demetria terragena]
MTATPDSTEAYRAARDQLLDWRGQPARAASEFQWPDVGDSFNFAIDWFDANARGNDAPCLTIVEADGATLTVTYDEMARRSDQVAQLLSKHGVRRDDAVIVMLGNQVELWETMLAIIKLGAVIMPTTTAVGPADLVDRMERGRAKAVVTNASETHKFDAVPGEYVRVSTGSTGEVSTSSTGEGEGEGDESSTSAGWVSLRDAYNLNPTPAQHPGNASTDRMLLYFTSGTTSKPKLVEHTHVSYPVGHLTTMYWLGLQPGDVHLNISSPGWAKHAWSCFFAPWIAQSTIFIYNFERFEPAALLETLARHEVTSLCAPPTVWRMLIKSDMGHKPASLREVIGAGEPLNPEIIEQVRAAWGLALRDGYGQTETTASVGNVPEAELKPGSMGQPLPGVPVVLVDPLTGTPAEPDEQGVAEGELCLDLAAKPLTLMTGYQGDPERNAVAMAGGFYHTGDVATRDTDGYITYVGRTDDVFKASDYKISPFELESVLIEHPAVAEAAIVPAPDSVRLSVPKAYVALAAGHEPTGETAEKILRHARERLAPWQRVRRIEFYELPKTISGKIRRVELRQREASHPSDQPRPDGVIGDGREWRDDEFGLRE